MGHDTDLAVGNRRSFNSLKITPSDVEPHRSISSRRERTKFLDVGPVQLSSAEALKVKEGDALLFGYYVVGAFGLFRVVSIPSRAWVA